MGRACFLYQVGIFVYIAPMRKIFIADAHLKSPDDPNYRALVRFLESLPPDTDTLFLMGDIFEFWIGNPKPVYEQYRDIVDTLKRVRGRGVRIVYFEGNHDFHLDGFFRDELQAEVHRGGAELSIGSQRVYLCHGDEINREDYRYRAFRLVLRSRLVKALVPIFSRRLADRAAATLSRRSSDKRAYRRKRWDYRQVLRDFAKERFASGCDAVITGHYHIPMLQAEPEGLLISIGDWITQYSYAQWLDGAFTLESFDPR